MPYSRQTPNSWVFFLVGLCYHFFSQTPDEEVVLGLRAKFDEGTFFFFIQGNPSHFYLLVRVFAVVEIFEQLGQPGETAGFTVVAIGFIHMNEYNITLRSKFYCYSCFANEETEAQS